MECFNKQDTKGLSFITHLEQIRSSNSSIFKSFFPPKLGSTEIYLFICVCEWKGLELTLRTANCALGNSWRFGGCACGRGGEFQEGLDLLWYEALGLNCQDWDTRFFFMLIQTLLWPEEGAHKQKNTWLFVVFSTTQFCHFSTVWTVVIIAYICSMFVYKNMLHWCNWTVLRSSLLYPLYWVDVFVLNKWIICIVVLFWHMLLKRQNFMLTLYEVIFVSCVPHSGFLQLFSYIVFLLCVCFPPRGWQPSGRITLHKRRGWVSGVF